jgi:hypothetical protein
MALPPMAKSANRARNQSEGSQNVVRNGPALPGKHTCLGDPGSPRVGLSGEIYFGARREEEALYCRRGERARHAVVGAR